MVVFTAKVHKDRSLSGIGGIGSRLTHYSGRGHLRLYERNLKVEEIGKCISRYSGLSSEETENSSELSFHSSEVSFHSSEVLFHPSVEDFHLLRGDFRLPRER